jgi:hypothetical protein
VPEKNHRSDLNLAKTIGSPFEEAEIACIGAECSGVLAGGNDVMLHAVSCVCIPEQPKKENIDLRGIQTRELSEIVNRSSEMNPKQKSQLFKLLNKYLPSFTTRPGKCRLSINSM